MKVLHCRDVDVDTLTGQCTDPFWIDPPGLLPTLGVSEALVLGSAVVAVWSLGFGFKLLRKFMYR